MQLGEMFFFVCVCVLLMCFNGKEKKIKKIFQRRNIRCHTCIYKAVVLLSSLTTSANSLH